MKPSNFSWVIQDKLAASAYPFIADNLVYYKAQGIKVVINLSEKIDYSDDSLIIYHFPIRDFSVPSTELLYKILNIMTTHISKNEPVVIHCIAGCGRTGTILAIWLAQHKWEGTAKEVIQHLKELRPCSLETKEQREFVINFIEDNSQ